MLRLLLPVLVLAASPARAQDGAPEPTPVPAAPPAPPPAAPPQIVYVQQVQKPEPECRVIRLGTPKEVARVVESLVDDGYANLMPFGTTMICGY